MPGELAQLLLFYLMYLFVNWCNEKLFL